jgi:hypothetical protein
MQSYCSWFARVLTAWHEFNYNDATSDKCELRGLRPN